MQHGRGEVSRHELGGAIRGSEGPGAMIGVGRRRRAPRAGAASSRRRRAAAGFTLLELLVVLGILAMLSTVAYPQVLRYLGSARTETAKAQVSALATAVELYALDNGGYPPPQVGLIALVQPPAGATRWRGPYIKRSDGLMDPWSRPYHYRLPGRASPFEVFSLGRDNTPGGAGEDQDVAN